MRKFVCGIDISSKIFDVEFMINGKPTDIKEYTNDAKGIKAVTAHTVKKLKYNLTDLNRNYLLVVNS